MLLRSRRTTLVAAVAGLVLAGGATAGAVALSGDDEVRAAGTCAGTTHELTVERDDDVDGLEVSFELQSAAPGETWTVELRHDDEVLLTGERATDEDAELDVDVAVADRDGDYTATFAQAGLEPCTATLTR